MAELRRDLSTDVQHVGESARAMADWTFYVRRFPWATAAIAAAVGFFLVPKKKEVITPDPEELAKLVRDRQLWVETAAQQKESQGMIKSLVLMGATYAGKMAMNHIIQTLQTRHAQASEDETPAPAPSPLEEPWQS
jgi:hypothetical protein